MTDVLIFLAVVMALVLAILASLYVVARHVEPQAESYYRRMRLGNFR